MPIVMMESQNLQIYDDKKTVEEYCSSHQDLELKDQEIQPLETGYNKMKENAKFLYLSGCVVNIISFTCGIAYAWSSPVIPKLNGSVDPENNPLPYKITPVEESWIAALLSLGAALGPFLCAVTADKIGRKNTLLAFALPVIASFLITAFANQVIFFYIARFMLGFGIGSVFAILPMYIGEIAEDHNRGSIGCFMAIFLTTGLLFSYAVGPYVSVKVFSLLCAVPPTIFIITFGLFIPESPYYLVGKKKQEAAEKSLTKLRNKCSSEVQKELLEITRNVEASAAEKAGIFDIFKSKSMRKGLTITVGLVFFQQVSGITVILSYMQSIFDATGSNIPSDISSIIIGIVQVFACCVTSFLVDKLGRRSLLLISATGSCIFQTSLGTYFYLKDNQYDVEHLFWLPILSLIVFIFSYNIGLSCLPWAIMGELFPPSMKAAGSTLTSFTCLIIAFSSTLFFPYLVMFIGMAQSFWLFSVCCAISFFFVLFIVPETKGKSLNEIQIMLSGCDK